MEDKKDVNLNKNVDDEVIKGVVDGKELSDEEIKGVTGGTTEGNIDDIDGILPCQS